MHHVIRLTILPQPPFLLWPDVRATRPRSMRFKKNTTAGSQQFGKDCSAEYLKCSPTLSQKCTDENKQMKKRGSNFKQNAAMK